MKKTILFAPIHYILDAENSGSEFSWSYEVFKFFSKNPTLKTLYITGGIRGIEDKRITNLHFFTPSKLNVSLVNVFIFHLRIFLESIKIVRSTSIDVIHHVLPFGLGTSFNLIAIFSSVPVVIGPIQPPLEVSDDDVDTRNALGFGKDQKPQRKHLQDLIFKTIRPIFTLLFYLTMVRAKKIIVVNNTAKKMIVKFGISEKKIKIIPPGIHVKQYKTSNKLGNKLRFVVIGHLRKRKGVEKVIEAFGKIRGISSSIQLDIIGDGPQKKALEEQVKRLQLEKVITFKGFMQNNKLKKQLCNYDMLLNMSKAEGFATIGLEALAAGLGIISTKVGGFTEVVTNNENGYLIRVDDVKALTQKITFIIKNKRLVSQFKVNSRKKAEKNYDWKNVIFPKYLKIYHTI